MSENSADASSVHLQRVVAAIRDATQSAPSFRHLAPGHRSASSQIYFIQAGEDGPIKIGRARNPRARLRALQVANHERLMLVGESLALEEPQAEAVERALHVGLAAFNVRGEWFRGCTEVLQVLALCGQPEIWTVTNGEAAA